MRHGSGGGVQGEWGSISRPKWRRQKEQKPQVSGLWAEGVAVQELKVSGRDPIVAQSMSPPKAGPQEHCVWDFRIHPVAPGGITRSLQSTGNLTEEGPEAHQRAAGIAWGVKTVTCAHSSCTCTCSGDTCVGLSGLCMEMEGVSVRLGTWLIILTCDTAFCLPVSFQPLAVCPGDGRWRHWEHQPCPPEGLLHQLQAVPNRGCAAPESLFQGPVSGRWAAWGSAKASGMVPGNVLS